MNLRNPIPGFFIRPLNTVIQIIFTALFSYAFILIYHPFGSQEWFEVNQGQFAFYAGFVVVIGMLVVIISRIVMTRVNKRWPVTIAGYAVMVALEVLAMTGFYMMIEKVFLKDQRFWFEVYYTAIRHTSLILLIPYLISLLYFAWRDKKQYLEQLLNKDDQMAQSRFVTFTDENGEVRLTVKLDDLLYIEANENYVFIHYMEQDQTMRYLLRSSMKRLGQLLSDFPVYRCHRSFMVNLRRVKLLKKDKAGYCLELDTPGKTILPLSPTYREGFTRMLN